MKVVRNISFELEAFAIERGRIVFKRSLYEVHCEINFENSQSITKRLGSHQFSFFISFLAFDKRIEYRNQEQIQI